MLEVIESVPVGHEKKCIFIEKGCFQAVVKEKKEEEQKLILPLWYLQLDSRFNRYEKRIGKMEMSLKKVKSI